MDPITTTIAAALAAGAISGITEAGKQAIADALGQVKNLIKSKFGDDSKIAQAVADLEQEPDFKPNEDALAGRVTQSQADQDQEIMAAVQALKEQIEAATPAGAQAGQSTSITGNNNVVTNVQQQAGDNAIQIGQARDVTVGRDK